MWAQHNERIKQGEYEETVAEAVKKACDLYQVQEFHGALWLTYDGNLVCPTDFLCNGGDMVKVIFALRTLYIKDVRGFKEVTLNQYDRNLL